jgi:hypothetical protein
VASIDMARRAVGMARGLRRLVRQPVTVAEAEAVVTDEVARRDDRFRASLDRLVWPFASSPARRLLDNAGIERGDVDRLVGAHGLVGALEQLRDAGVYVSYEEYHGRIDARRGSAVFTFSPSDFFNPVTPADYIATTGGSRSSGTPVELSFAWQRRQGAQRAIQFDRAGVRGAPTATWLPVFPSAAGYGAVMKLTAGGNRPERWFSQVPIDLDGISSHKQLANKFLPALSALARAGLPSPEYAPTSDPEPVVRWLADAVQRHGSAVITGYASSLTAAARWAREHGVALDGVVAYPSSEPVTAGKLAAMRAAGMRAHPTYAFVPEGTVALSCEHCDDEEYHLWEQELAVITRRRPRSDDADVDAFLLTSLAHEAPRVLVNVENDDYGVVRHDVECSCGLGSLGLRTRISAIRGISKVVAAGISLDGEVFDRIVETELPARVGGGAGDYQFVEREGASGTTMSLRVSPDIDLNEEHLRDAIDAALRTSDNGVLAAAVWERNGGLRIERSTPLVTKAGKTLSFERIGGPALPANTETTT